MTTTCTIKQEWAATNTCTYSSTLDTSAVVEWSPSDAYYKVRSGIFMSPKPTVTAFTSHGGTSLLRGGLFYLATIRI